MDFSYMLQYRFMLQGPVKLHCVVIIFSMALFGMHLKENNADVIIVRIMFPFLSYLFMHITILSLLCKGY